ncbi:hypothetical protein MPSEU_000098900 [Mayamaea pseudoterrestris]|nr:hypothetical protein MPSEU_000098900 [Mayamaea pseudoterrestris]
MRFSIAPLLALPTFMSVDAFTIRTGAQIARPRREQLFRLMESGKGFGAEPAKKKASSPSDFETETEIATPARNLASQQAKLQTRGTGVIPNEQQQPPLNAGQAALERMRRQKAEQEEDELRNVRDLLLQDKLAKETPAVIPEKVAQRMGRRMLPFVGLPLFAAMGTFVGFWYFATYKNMEFQPAAVATTTVFLLFVGLLGITYSLLSASWDPDREGDLLGVDEFKTNVENIKAGLNRSRENTLLREKMADVGEGEIKAALNELERKEKAEARRKQSLVSKLNDELD